MSFELPQKDILVVGSCVLDNVIRVDEFPRPGESVVAHQLNTFLGGKGCNQAVAAKRLGAKVHFAGALGNDGAGHEFLQRIKAEDIDVQHVRFFDEVPTGQAFISLNLMGQNMISVMLGANMHLLEDHGFNATVDTRHDVLLMQGEIPIETNFACASASQGLVIFNPAPACSIPPKMYEHLDYLTPNEHEAAFLVGEANFNVHRIFESTSALLDRGVQNVVITLGAMGAAFANSETKGMVYAPKVVAADTVGAGDCFNGALAFAVAHGADLESATRFAVECASISVQSLGAQTGLPYWYELSESIRSILQIQPTV
jgi:ribokinase